MVVATNVDHLLTSAIDSMSNVVFVKDVNLRYVYANKAYLAKNQIVLEQLIGRTAKEVLPEPTASQCDKMDRAVLTDGKCSVVEATFQVKGPAFERAEISLTPTRNSQGEVVGVMGIVRDISVQYERELNALAMAEYFQGKDERRHRPVCSGCKCFRDVDGNWVEPGVGKPIQAKDAYLTHTFCKHCSDLFLS